MVCKRRLSTMLAAVLILTVAPGLCIISFAKTIPEVDSVAEQHFQKANDLHILADYDAAIAAYQTVIRLAPNSKIAQNAQYWIGQLYFESKEFEAALSAFQKLLNEYPESKTISATKIMVERIQQAMKNRSLFNAVKKDDTEQAKHLIAEGADIHAKWGDTNSIEEGKKAKAWAAYHTPLYFAADSNNVELVRFFVEAGANVNAGEWPALCQALYRGNTTIVKFLIDHGANVNFPPDWGPLHEASCSDVEMVKLLLDNGADINAGYCPPLHTAAMKGPSDVIELLIQRGADINAKDTWKCTPLYWTINNMFFSKSKDTEIEKMKLLIANGADVNAKFGEGGGVALIFAAGAGQAEAVKILLAAGANITAKNNRGQTALHAMLDIKNTNKSRYRMSKGTLELLLANGADINSKDNDGQTPLLLAAESADAEIVELLLDKGADIDAKDDKSGATALHHAARLSKKDVAELLITRGADINARDKQGHTPLYVAVNHGYQVAELLIDKGADSAIRTESGQTLFQLTQQRKAIESTAPDMILDGEPNSMFGGPVACGDINGDGYGDILIGATKYSNARGRVYLYYGGPDMDESADLILEGQNEEDNFGGGIGCGDIDNDGREDIVIAAGSYSQRQDRVYLHWGRDQGSMDAEPDKIFVGEKDKDTQFGWKHPVVYDIDNDGYDDIILGASSSGGGTGRAFLYYGNTKQLMDTSHDLVFTGDNPKGYFGGTISCGDIDSDGFGDIVIGGYSKQGRAYLFYGNDKSNMDAETDVIFKSKSEGDDYFGLGIVCFDQNADGYDDVVVGAAGYNKWQGRAYLFHGNSKGSLDTVPDMTFDSEVGCRSYGIRETYGDIDGDHVNDLIIGGGSKVYVYWGDELADLDPKPGRILTGENPNDKFGNGLACGDVNNDGFDDIIIGARGYKAGAKQGRVYLYYGGPRNK